MTKYLTVVLSVLFILVPNYLFSSEHNLSVGVLDLLLKKKILTFEQTVEKYGFFAYIGDGNIINSVKNTKTQNQISIYENFYQKFDLSEYKFKLLNGPDGLSVDSKNGLVTYNANSYALPGKYEVNVSINNHERDQVFTFFVNLIDSDIYLEGVIGTGGGTLADDGENVVLIVPEDAVLEDTKFKIFKYIDGDGYYKFKIEHDGNVVKPLSFRIPERHSRKVQPISISKSSDKTNKLNENGFIWINFYSNYIRMMDLGGIFIKNRVKNDSNTQYVLDNINYTTDELAARLVGFCGGRLDGLCEDFTKNPVLLIHGYSPAGIMGDSYTTFGNLGKLLYDLRYQVFSFNWKTNCRFEDAAADLAVAIRIIKQETGKNVHLIAHSFGGVLARTYLEGEAIDYYINNKNEEKVRYGNDVASLLTIGTPHSGIFPKNNLPPYGDSPGPLLGRTFFQGQEDTIHFANCYALTCHEAGQKTNRALFVWQPENFNQHVMINDWFGVELNEGQIIKKLYWEHNKLPVDAKILIGLTVDLNDEEDVKDDTFETGDALITYAGQRFLPTSGNSPTSEGAIYASDNISVFEEVLGFDHGAVPGGDLDSNPEKFKGFRHIESGRALSLNSSIRGSQGEAVVNNVNHEAYPIIRDWLDAHNDVVPVEDYKITLSGRVFSAETSEPVQGVHVWISTDNEPGDNLTMTDNEGRYSLEVYFRPRTTYRFWFYKEGYLYSFKDNLFRSSDWPGENENTNLNVKIIPEAAETRGNVHYVVVDDESGEPINGILVNFSRNGVYADTTSNINGEIILNDLAQGEWLLTLSSQYYKDKEYMVNIIGGQISTQTFRLDTPVYEYKAINSTIFSTGSIIGPAFYPLLATSANTISAQEASVTFNYLDSDPSNDDVFTVYMIPGDSPKEIAEEFNSISLMNIASGFNQVTIKNLSIPLTSLRLHIGDQSNINILDLNYNLYPGNLFPLVDLINLNSSSVVASLGSDPSEMILSNTSGDDIILAFEGCDSGTWPTFDLVGLDGNTSTIECTTDVYPGAQNSAMVVGGIYFRSSSFFTVSSTVSASAGSILDVAADIEDPSECTANCPDWAP